ncbi:hypothetical protein EPI10_007299 [Gossypium australe]|uniref:Uncharacterized protein n=1 Tax=Gossypium australe TaxID=47621 RepID=A0A5B6WW69_9ROSI|nr:hypothetical protein EPI10_007299 [Gossypium australe]
MKSFSFFSKLASTPALAHANFRREGHQSLAMTSPSTALARSTESCLAIMVQGRQTSAGERSDAERGAAARLGVRV